MSSGLAWAAWTVTELFMIDRHPHLPTATMLQVLDQPCLRHLCAALGRCRVRLATGSSSSAAVGETVAHHAIEPRSSHGRHGGRERRGYPSRRHEAPRRRVFFGGAAGKLDSKKTYAASLLRRPPDGEAVVGE